jgi:hypothetical protein
MRRTCLALRWMFVVSAMLMPAAAHADDNDAMDLAFWQSIQNSTNPAEYQSYLDAFPHGKFAKLATIRANQVLPSSPAIPLPQTVPGAPAASVAASNLTGDDASADSPAEKIVLDPTAPRVGQTIIVTCENFPEPSTFDILMVVPAGTPVIDPTGRPIDQTKMVSFGYAMNCARLPQRVGPFAPGAYEIRFMTRLYNNTGVLELHAKTGFRVH